MNFADDLNFRIAFGARLIGDKTLYKYDPQIIRWAARMTSKDDEGVIASTIFPLHDCTEKDFEDFHPL